MNTVLIFVLFSNTMNKRKICKLLICSVASVRETVTKEMSQVIGTKYILNMQSMSFGFYSVRQYQEFKYIKKIY